MFKENFIISLCAILTIVQASCVLPKCGKNEEAVECKKSCPPDTCQSLYVKYKCKEDQKGEPGCICKKDYKRWDDVCIPKDECPPAECINDPNAILGRADRCGKICADYNTKKKCPEKCDKGCDCKDKYVYDEKVKKCVLPKDCTPVCAANEEYTCGTACEQPSCSAPEPCACDKKCKNGCYCKKGYLRNEKNECVPKDKCVKCKPNSHYTKCADACPATCECTLPDKDCKKKCEPGCQCDDGYVLSKIGGDCVKIEKCKTLPICKKNETWVSCNPKCPDEECPRDDKPQPVCDAPKPCPGGCRCKPGYRYNNHGDCILACECPEIKCTRKNEVWASCASPDLKEDCDNRQNCDNEKRKGICIPRCVCKKGYYRNKKDECVPACDCPSKH